MASRSQFNQAWVLLSLIVSLLIAVCARGPAQAQAAAPPNVIAIGDSITDDFGNGGWRGPLKAKLAAVGQAINYVGSRSDGAGNHEAYGGATSCDFSTDRGSFMANTYGKAATWDIRTALAAAAPNIAIIDIGTNNYIEDYYLAHGLATTVPCGLNPGSLHWLWDAVVYQPGITGVVITTVEDSLIPDGTENVNVLVRQYVADRQAQGLNVCLGELPSSFAGLTTDQFHLNAAGKDAVAAALLTPTLTAIAGTCAAAVTGTLPVVTIAATANAAEPSTNGQFTVSRTGSLANPLTVNFTVSGSATAGSDYATIGTSVVIPAGAATAAIAVNVIDDTIYEGSETVVVSLSPNASYAVGSANSATVTITDNELPTVISVSPNGASPGDLLTVTWSGIVNPTARDWMGLFAVGAGNGSFITWIYVNCSQGGSTVPKASGACIVPLPAGVANGTYQFRLLSNDSFNVMATSNPLVVGLPAVSVVATANAAEPSTNGQFTVSRTGSTTSSLAVNFTVSGSATPGVDYANLGSSVVIPAGSAAANIGVNVIDDAIYEGTETVVVTLTANPAYIIGSSSATVTIADDDKPVVSIIATDSLAAEAGLDTGTFTVSRDGVTTAPLTVNYAVGGTATNGVDYQLLSGSLTIPAGQVSGTIVVTPIDDNLFEGNETVIVTLIGNGSYLLGIPNSATVTIADNDAPATTPTIGLSFDGQSADRVGQGEFALSGDGNLDGIFTVTLNAGSGNRTVTRLQLTNTPGGVWNTQGGDGYWSLGAATSVGGALFNAANDAVNFALSEGSSFKIFAADWQNAMFQNGVVFTLTANFADGSSVSASTTINPVALPVVTIAASGANAAEGGAAGQFTVTRTGSMAAALTVNYAIGGTATNGADYQTLSGSISIAAGLASALIDVIPVDDNIVEGSETVILTINPTAAYSLGSASSATVTIADNDLLPSSPTIAFSYDGRLRDRVGEGELAAGQSPDGKLDGTFTVMLNAGSGNRTVTRLQLTNSLGGIWDTVGGDSYWLVGAAVGLDGSLFNLSADAVNFALSEGATFKIFASDWQDLMYVNGVVFTLTVTFADGSTAIANTTVTDGASSPVISLNYDGLLRDRVGEGELALGQSPDGKLDGTFSVMLNTGTGNRTVTQLQLTNNLGGIWDTIGGDSYWLVGAAVGLDSVLLNGTNDAVNFPVAEGGSFKIFAPDWQNLMFVPGVKFTLTANFADGSSASSSATIP